MSKEISLKERIEAIARHSKTERRYSLDDLLSIRELESKSVSEKITASRKKNLLDRAVGRSGIHPLHQSCSVQNFIADTKDKMLAKKTAFDYITSFDRNNGRGFIFSGTPGTGKNHLAAAICNALISQGKSCLIITINEMMQKLRNTYQKESKITEDQFIQNMINYDLLILDEVGLQRGTDAESLAINQIVDQRVCRIKPTGMLTNLGTDDLTKLLGMRVVGRMQMNKGIWVSFNWESFRK